MVRSGGSACSAQWASEYKATSVAEQRVWEKQPPSHQRERGALTGFPSAEMPLKASRATITSRRSEAIHVSPSQPGSAAQGCDSASVYGTLQWLPKGTTVIETAENNCWQKTPYLE